MKVNCPTCNKELAWKPENKFRPFCSERCKLIDLGEWANGEKVIAGKPLMDNSFINEGSGNDDGNE